MLHPNVRPWVLVLCFAMAACTESGTVVEGAMDTESSTDAADAAVDSSTDSTATQEDTETWGPNVQCSDAVPCPGAAQKCIHGRCLFGCLTSRDCGDRRQDCPEGQRGSVDEQLCWSGECVDETLCTSYPTSNIYGCDPDTQYVDTYYQPTCLPLPAACMDNKECDICSIVCTVGEASCTGGLQSSTGRIIIECYTGK